MENQKAIVQMYQTLKNSQNPEQMFNQMISKSPEMKKIVDTIQALGDPQKAFYMMAEKQGVDPNSIINMLNQV